MWFNMNKKYEELNNSLIKLNETVAQILTLNSTMYNLLDPVIQKQLVQEVEDKMKIENDKLVANYKASMKKEIELERQNYIKKDNSVAMTIGETLNKKVTFRDEIINNIYAKVMNKEVKSLPEFRKYLSNIYESYIQNK